LFNQQKKTNKQTNQQKKTNKQTNQQTKTNKQTNQQKKPTEIEKIFYKYILSDEVI
jgi:hypothetical protein